MMQKPQQGFSTMKQAILTQPLRAATNFTRLSLKFPHLQEANIVNFA